MQKCYNILKPLSSDTLQSTKRQSKVPSEQDGKYLPSCGSKTI